MPFDSQTPPPSVSVDLTLAESVSFVMECAGIPVLQDVTVTNSSDTALSGVELGVALAPGLGTEQRFPIGALPARQNVSLAVLDFRLEPGFLRSVLERETAQLVIRVRAEGAELARVERAVPLLPFNQWPGLTASPGLLASFVTPNEPAIFPILRSVGEELQRATSDASILGYQEESIVRARAEVTALYEAIRELGIRYVGVPPSFEGTGQKVRLVETVVNEKVANCLDISLLFASALEAMGFAPLIVLLETHAFAAVWLQDDRFPEGVLEDAARLRTHAQLGSIFFFDPTACLSGQSLAEAEAVAREHIRGDERFRVAMDVRALRRQGYLPLPIRAERVGAGAGAGAGATVPMPLVTWQEPRPRTGSTTSTSWPPTARSS